MREIFTVHSAPAHVPKSLTLNVVEVREVDPPKNEAPVIWRLATTEPVDTEEQVAAVVDAYRQRWLVEEFFKALKTGCRFQQLQLESSRALLIVLCQSKRRCHGDYSPCGGRRSIDQTQTRQMYCRLLT